MNQIWSLSVVINPKVKTIWSIPASSWGLRFRIPPPSTLQSPTPPQCSLRGTYDNRSPPPTLILELQKNASPCSTTRDSCSEPPGRPASWLGRVNWERGGGATGSCQALTRRKYLLANDSTAHWPFLVGLDPARRRPPWPRCGEGWVRGTSCPGRERYEMEPQITALPGLLRVTQLARLLLRLPPRWRHAWTGQQGGGGGKTRKHTKKHWLQGKYRVAAAPPQWCTSGQGGKKKKTLLLKSVLPAKCTIELAYLVWKEFLLFAESEMYASIQMHKIFINTANNKNNNLIVKYCFVNLGLL